MATTDNSIDLARRIPRGSYILNKEASDMFPNMKNVASMFSATKNEMLNGDNVMLTDEEIYIPPSGVKAIGVEMLEFMNNKPDEGGHSSIDNLINMATLENIKPMYKGGEVKSYMGGGYNMDGYEGGGRLYDYKQNPDQSITTIFEMPASEIDGGEGMRYYKGMSPLLPSIKMMIKNAQRDAMNKMQTTPGDSISLEMAQEMMNPKKSGFLKKLLGMQDGGMINKSLKPVPNNNPGLAKLPEDVRNKMGYMQDGGLMGMMYGGMKKKNMYGYQDGGMVQDDAMMEQYLQAMQEQQGGNGFVPLDQRSSDSGGTMSTIPEGMQPGDMMRMIRDSVDALKAQEDLLTIQKADTALQRIEQARMLEEPFVNQANTSSNRNLMEYLKQQSMQRGADNVRMGGGEDILEMIR